MAVFYKVTLLKRVGRLAPGMWIELVFQNNSSIPMQRDIIDGFNAKYGAGMVTGTISKDDLRIEKG